MVDGYNTFAGSQTDINRRLLRRIEALENAEAGEATDITDIKEDVKDLEDASKNTLLFFTLNSPFKLY